jgi:type VI secretion system secreted protein VgrG
MLMKKVLTLVAVAAVFYFIGYAQTTPRNLNLTATDQIVLTTGKASITMKKDGTILIKGGNITMDGSGTINIKASGEVTVKGRKILEN